MSRFCVELGWDGGYPEPSLPSLSQQPLPLPSRDGLSLRRSAQGSVSYQRWACMSHSYLLLMIKSDKLCLLSL